MNGKFTIEFSVEDRERIDRLIAALEGAGTPYAQPVTAETAPAEPSKPVKAEAPKPEATPTVTHADVQKLVVKIAASDKEKKALVREIVNGYADKVSAIPEDKLPEVLERLKEVEAGLA